MILKDVNFHLYSSEIIAIVGKSGAGKTTLLNILVGLIEATSGKIINYRSKIGYVFQEDRLMKWLTVFENIRLVNENISDEEIFRILELVNLKEFYNYFPEELSGGMKQRVSIARALCYAGDIILLDEPFKSLDTKLRYELLDLMKRLKKENKVSFILVTHDIEEAIYVADRILILQEQDGYSSITKEIKLKNKNDDKIFDMDELKIKKEILEYI